MKRRDLIVGVAASLSMPVLSHGQERLRRLAVLMALESSDPQRDRRLDALRLALEALGWIEGRNLRIDTRVGFGPENIRKNITELMALSPDVMLSAGASSLEPLLRVTRTLPIVFVNIADPVGAGIVDSLAQPGGNVTGILQAEYDLSGKLPELLKQIAPGVLRAGVLRDPSITTGIGQFAVIQSVAPVLGLDIRPINVREAADVERGIAAFARSGQGGLIAVGSATINVNRDRIAALALQHKLPSVFANRTFVDAGGLISYGPQPIDQYRQVAGHIDRILKGDKPANLPVQAPTKYELVLNLRTAKALGLEVPLILQQRADEVIE